VKQYQARVAVITKEKLSANQAEHLFGQLSKDERNLITFLFCKNYQVVLDKLLDMDNQVNVPKFLIIDKLVRITNKT
jgi:hypothetical protein